MFWGFLGVLGSLGNSGSFGDRSDWRVGIQLRVQTSLNGQRWHWNRINWFSSVGSAHKSIDYPCSRCPNFQRAKIPRTAKMGKPSKPWIHLLRVIRFWRSPAKLQLRRATVSASLVMVARVNFFQKGISNNLRLVDTLQLYNTNTEQMLCRPLGQVIEANRFTFELLYSIRLSWCRVSYRVKREDICILTFWKYNVWRQRSRVMNEMPIGSSP